MPRRIGRYLLCDEVASGGMGTVHLGCVFGDAGFSRTVAIKRLHDRYADDPQFSAMFVDEARIAARIHHPNVVGTLDVVRAEGMLLLVMEYLHGEPLSNLVRFAERDDEPMPLDVASAIVCDTLHGLHAAHEATAETGEPLEIVHRDVSPQNVFVGADGITRVLDFGVAKAAGQLHRTQQGMLRGKIAYMAPEQLHGRPIDRRVDVFAAGVMLWELLAERRLFASVEDAEALRRALETIPPPPSVFAPGIPRAVDDVVLRALERDPAARFASARDMAQALEASVGVASPRRVAEWVDVLAGDRVAERKRRLVDVERAAAAGALEIAAPPARARARRRGVAWAVAAGAAILVAAIPITVRWLRGRAVHDAAGAEIAGARAPSAAPPEAPEPPPSTEPTAPSAPAVPPTSPAPRAAAASPARKAARRGESPRPAGSGDCAVTSYVDADGIVRFRRDCGK